MNLETKGGEIGMIKENPPHSGLDYIMRLRGISTEALAQEIGVTAKTVNAWRKGENIPQKERRKDVSDLLEENEYYLFFQEGGWGNERLKLSS